MPTIGKKSSRCAGTGHVPNKKRWSFKKSERPAGWTEELEREWEESGPHVYDKAKWHYEGDYPKGLQRKQAFVYTGLFLA